MPRRNNRNPNPQVPARMTGGVDYTGTVDLDTPGVLDTLEMLNRQPEVIQTLTGGHGSLYGDVNMPADDDVEPEANPEMLHSLQTVATRYDGTPVRVVPNSRFRTMRYLVPAGNTLWIAGVDARRRFLGITIYGPADNSLYVAPDISTVLTTGFELRTIVGGIASMVLTHGDSVAIGADAANNATLRVSLAFEFLE